MEQEILNHLILNKPVITIATLGSLTYNFDETYLIDLIINSIDNDKISKDIQLLVRLHPTTKLDIYTPSISNENVKYLLSINSFPIRWTMNDKDVDAIANILYHSDVIISPGSTVTIEAAIFDTPIYFQLLIHQQSLLDDFYRKNYWEKHFKKFNR